MLAGQARLLCCLGLAFCLYTFGTHVTAAAVIHVSLPTGDDCCFEGPLEMILLFQGTVFCTTPTLLPIGQMQPAKQIFSLNTSTP